MNKNANSEKIYKQFFLKDEWLQVMYKIDIK